MPNKSTGIPYCTLEYTALKALVVSNVVNDVEQLKVPYTNDNIC